MTNSTTEVTKTFTDYADRFGAALVGMTDGVYQCGLIYVEAIEDNPKYAEQFAEKFSDTIPPSAWASFEAVGRKWLHPKLLLGNGGQNTARIKRLPYSLQDRIFAGERFDLLLIDGEVLKVDVRQATKDQAEQLLVGSHVRTVGEQRAYMEARAKSDSAKGEKVQSMPYHIVGGKFRPDPKIKAEYTKAELRTILMEM